MRVAFRIAWLRAMFLKFSKLPELSGGRKFENLLILSFVLFPQGKDTSQWLLLRR